MKWVLRDRFSLFDLFAIAWMTDRLMKGSPWEAFLGAILLAVLSALMTHLAGTKKKP